MAASPCWTGSSPPGEGFVPPVAGCCRCGGGEFGGLVVPCSLFGRERASKVLIVLNVTAVHPLPVGEGWGEGLPVLLLWRHVAAGVAEPFLCLFQFHAGDAA